MLNSPTAAVRLRLTSRSKVANSDHRHALLPLAVQPQLLGFYMAAHCSIKPCSVQTHSRRSLCHSPCRRFHQGQRLVSSRSRHLICRQDEL